MYAVCQLLILLQDHLDFFSPPPCNERVLRTFTEPLFYECALLWKSLPWWCPDHEFPNFQLCLQCCKIIVGFFFFSLQSERHALLSVSLYSSCPCDSGQITSQGSDSAVNFPSVLRYNPSRWEKRELFCGRASLWMLTVSSLHNMYSPFSSLKMVHVEDKEKDKGLHLSVSSLHHSIWPASSKPNTYFFLLIVQSLNRVWLFVTPWTAAHQASLCFTVSRSLLNLLRSRGHPDLFPPEFCICSCLVELEMCPSF